MEDKDDKQPSKTPRGQGYTRRVNGKKQLTTTLLEQQLQHAQARLRDLESQNDLLRMKESMQLVTLEAQELALHTLAEAEAEQAAPSTERSSETLLSAMLLDVRAHELKQALQTLQLSAQQPGTAAQPAGPSTAAQEIVASTFCTPLEEIATGAAPGAAVTTSDSASNSGASGTSGTSSGACSTPDEAGSSGHSRRMQRLMESVTPVEVQEAQDKSLQEIAERLKGHYARMALARRNADRAKSGVASADLDREVDEYMRCNVISLISNDNRHCLLTGINFETLQPQTPPEDFWDEVVLKANLQPQQVEHITKAYQAYTVQQAQLLEEHQALMQQLQGLLGSAHTPDPPAGAIRADEPCAAAGGSEAQNGAAVGSGTAAAATAPAYFMSLATGCAVRGVSAQLSEGAPAWMFGAAAVAASQAQTRTRSAVLRAKAAAAASGTGSSSSAEAVHMGPEVGQQQQQLLSGLHANELVEGGSTEAAAAVAAEGPSRSSSGSWLAPEGMLALEDADKAEKVLQAWQLVCTQMKRQARSLAAVLMNMLTSEQFADATLAGYPFHVPAPKFCAHVVQMSQNSQEGPRH